MREAGGAILIRIPSALRPYSDGADALCVSAASVAEALSALEHRYPRLRGLIRDEQGRVRRHVNIFRGEDEIRALDGLTTLLPPGATLTILPAISGGSP